MYRSLSRRSFLAAAGALGASSLASAMTPLKTAQRPDPATFQTGDFVWPKPPGAFVPYAGTPRDRTLVDSDELREDEWTELRVRFILRARGPRPNVDPAKIAFDRQVADVVESMPYSRFFHEYAGDSKPDEFQKYGVGQLAYVGHVGIIEVDSTRVPWVIEAVYGKSLACTSCVQRVRYDDWLKARGEVLVWHGRLLNQDAGKRAEIATVARQQLNKPYDFFNFDLMDDSGFYCSKLIWYSVMRAANIAVDGKTDPRRMIWFSPLQAIKARATVEVLSSPGNYQNT